MGKALRAAYIFVAFVSGGCGGTRSSQPQAPCLVPLPIASACEKHVPKAAPRNSAVAPRVPPKAKLFDDDVAEAGFFPRKDAEEAKFDGPLLDELIAEAERTQSDSLIILRNGAVVVERYFGKPRGPIETMSVTKSITSLAIGMLLEDKRIESLDVPVGRYFPEWRKGAKARVTLRHLLTHTSGIQARPTDKRFLSYDDRLAHARALPVKGEPGASFSYSNEGTQLLAGIVEKAARRPLDDYVRERLWKPLSISDTFWAKDKSGGVQAYYGAGLRGRDLAKLGQLLLNRGEYQGRMLLSPAWVRQVSSPGIDTGNAHYGLLFWLRPGSSVKMQTGNSLATVAAKGFAATDKLAPLTGIRFPSESAYYMHAGRLLSDDEVRELARAGARGAVPFETIAGKTIGFYADGWLGQKLAVYPEYGVVAVRQHRRTDGLDGDTDNKRFGFADFYKRVEATFLAD